MAPRIARLAAAAVLQLGALVLAHELVFLARYGSRFGEALVHSGHGEAWSAAALTSMLLAGGLVGLGIVRLYRLGALARRAGAAAGQPTGELPWRALLRTFLRLAPRVALLQLVLLSVQENIEHAAIGQATPGPGILFSPEYAGGAWIALGVSLVASFVAALFAWRRDVLLARLRAARATLPRVSSNVPSRPGVLVRHAIESVLGRRSALRAPPPVASPA